MCAKQRKILHASIMICLFVFIICSFSCYGYGASISGDEYFSIGFANNTEDFLFVTRGAVEEYGVDGWIEGDFLHDWLSVQPGEEFAIMQIHRNVRSDVHPPLYFMLLNFISSFFVDQVTLLPGYIINVCSGIVICIFIYLISRRVFENEWLAYVPVLFWAASNAANITMTYIRMYGVLSALCLICLYLHLLFLDKEKPSKYLYVFLGVSTTIGTLTHYYFYIWLFVVFCITVSVCIYRKNIKKLLLYGLSLGIAEIVSVAAYPYVFKHLLFSERGTQVQQNLANSDWDYYVKFFGEFMDTINRYVYTNQFIIVFYTFVGLVLLVILFIIFSNKKKESLTETDKLHVLKKGYFDFLVITIVAFGYFMILFKISYSANWIYISPIFPLLAIITIGVFAIVLKRINSKYYAYILFVVCAFGMVRNNVTNIRWSISNHEQIETRHEKIVKYSEDADVIFFYNEWNNLYDNQILELMEFNQIYAVPIEEMEDVDYNSILSKRKEKNDLICYISTSIQNYNSIIHDVADKVGAVSMVPIVEDSHAVFLLDIK